MGSWIARPASPALPARRRLRPASSSVPGTSFAGHLAVEALRLGHDLVEGLLELVLGPDARHGDAEDLDAHTGAEGAEDLEPATGNERRGAGAHDARRQHVIDERDRRAVQQPQAEPDARDLGSHENG